LDALAGVEGIPGRLERVDSNHEFAVFVDYAHTPDGLEKCVASVRDFCAGRVVTVFGCGGDRDRTKRPLMGECAARLSDYCIVTSDNPRTEEPLAIINDILAGIPVEKRAGVCMAEPDRKKAIQKAVQMALPGDVVLICGKGHEKKQIMGGETLDFDDCQAAREALSRITA
jgi:UDP-N-acetylmuramoyl-L-alanyl-D-glutamate--2,6-diaminopimelate ligase